MSKYTKEEIEQTMQSAKDTVEKGIKLIESNELSNAVDGMTYMGEGFTMLSGIVKHLQSRIPKEDHGLIMDALAFALEKM